MQNKFSYQLNRHGKFIFSAILTLALTAFLRIFNLLSLPMFADEAIYIRWSQIMKNDATLRFLPTADGKQPLFMWVTIPFFKFFHDPLIAGRMVSAFCGLGSALGIFFLSYELFKNKKISLFSVLLYALSPYSLFFDRMALVDSMLMMFGIWVLLFAVKTAKSIRLDYAMITGFFLGAAWLTKSSAEIFILLLPTTFLLVPKNKKLSAICLKLIPLFTISIFIAYGMYSVLRLGPSFQMLALRSGDYLFPVHDVIKNPFHSLSLNLFPALSWIIILTPVTFFLVGIYSFIIKDFKFKKELFLLTLWLVIPFVIELEIARVFTSRYLLFTMFPLYILGGISLFYLSKLKRKIFIPLLIFILLPAAFNDYYLLTNPERAILPRNDRAGYLEAWTAGTGIREAANYLTQEHENNPQEHIVVGAEGAFGALPDGLRIYIEDLPNVTVTGHDVPDLEGIDAQLITAKKAGDKVYLVINQSRFHAKPEDVGIVVLQKYPKALKPDGTRDYLMVYEVTSKAIDIYDQSQLDIKKNLELMNKTSEMKSR